LRKILYNPFVIRSYVCWYIYRIPVVILNWCLQIAIPGINNPLSIRPNPHHTQSTMQNKLSFSNTFTGGRFHHYDTLFIAIVIWKIGSLLVHSIVTDSWTNTIKQHYNQVKAQILFATIFRYLRYFRYSIYYYLDISDSNAVSDIVVNMSMTEWIKW